MKLKHIEIRVVEIFRDFQMNFKLLLSIILSGLLSSCAFNKMFLQPTVISDNVYAIKYPVTSGDTTILHFDSLTYQPTFLKQNKDTIQHNYTIESVVFESKSGNKLNGWMIKSKTVVPSITLLHFHGNAGFIMSQYQAMTPLLEKGFQAFVFDYSGFGFSKGKATRNNVLLDGNSALDYVKSRDDAKDTKLIIYGQSLGGHLSAVVANQRQNEIDGLVIEGAFSSHKDIAAKVAGFIGRWFVSEKYSAKQAIKDFHKPVLIIHSTEDETIPVEMGRKLFENANEPKEYYEIQHPHIQGTQFYRDSIATKILRMIR